MEALGAGLHVFCEKPMALTARECDDMIAAAEEAGRVLQIGYVRRFQPEFVGGQGADRGRRDRRRHARQVADARSRPAAAWAHDLALSNGMLAEVNSHCFDSVRWLAGATSCACTRRSRTARARGSASRPSNFYDNAVVSLRFANDAIGSIDGVCPAEYGYDGRVEVIGTEGLIMIGDVNGMPLITAVDRERGGVRPTHKTWPERFSWGYVREIDAFVEAARSRHGARRSAGCDGKRAVEAVVAANRSWQEGRPVELAEAAV